MNKWCQVLLGSTLGLIIGGTDYMLRVAPDVEPDITSLFKDVQMIDVPAGTFQINVPIAKSFTEKTYVTKDVMFYKEFRINAHEVTIGQWQRCYDAGGCKRPAKIRKWQTENHPITHVNWADAQQFMVWISQVTGRKYRLPTEEEWLYVAYAGRNYTQKVDPYEYNYALTLYQATDKTEERGTFGANKWDVYDMAGSTTEWTLTCWRASEDKNLEQISPSQLENRRACGVRVLQGDERVHLPYFIKDASGGGCSTSKPPSNIGFRFVEEV